MKTDSSSMAYGVSGGSIGSGVCRFVMKPFPECYCYAISSVTIPNMVNFCGNDFESCPIYRKCDIKRRIE